MVFLHGYLKYTQPLFIQSLMGVKGLYDAKIVAIHILGKPAEGDLKRPFKGPGGLFGGKFSRNWWSFLVRWLFFPPSAASEPQTDKAAIDEAEKRVGAKKEE